LKKNNMDFDEYFKKMCGDSGELPTSKFKVNGTTTPFNKKELRWLKEQLESCIEWSNPVDPTASKHMHKGMLKKVEERLGLL